MDVILEDLYDSKVLIAWGPGGVVLSFRGTASLKNANTDIRVGSFQLACYRSLALGNGKYAMLEQEAGMTYPELAVINSESQA